MRAAIHPARPHRTYCPEVRGLGGCDCADHRQEVRRYETATGRVIEVENLLPGRIDLHGNPAPYWFATCGQWCAEGESFGKVMTEARQEFGPLTWAGGSA